MNMHAAQFLASLNDTYCRLVPTTHGVGVRAIRPIPKGVDPFKNCDPFGSTLLVPERELEAAPVPESAKELVRDYCTVHDGMYHVPSYGIDAIDKSYFLNHSETPNLETPNHGETFIAARDIAEGEELTADYATYGQPTTFEG